MDEISASVVVGYFIVAVLQTLKRQPWFTLMEPGADVLNRIVASVVALLATIGIHVTFDAQAGTLLITGLTMSSLLQFGLEFARQFVIQQITFKAAFKNGGGMK